MRTNTILIAILCILTGCDGEDYSPIDHSKKIPNGFLSPEQIKSYRNTSFNCESAIFKASDLATKNFISYKTSKEFIVAEKKNYQPWEETPTNTHNMMVSGKCAEKLFGDDYLKILESPSSYHTSHRQSFLLFNPNTSIIYYVFQGN